MFVSFVNTIVTEIIKVIDLTYRVVSFVNTIVTVIKDIDLTYLVTSFVDTIVTEIIKVIDLTCRIVIKLMVIELEHNSFGVVKVVENFNIVKVIKAICEDSDHFMAFMAFIIIALAVDINLILIILILIVLIPFKLISYRNMPLNLFIVYHPISWYLHKLNW